MSGDVLVLTPASDVAAGDHVLLPDLDAYVRVDSVVRCGDQYLSPGVLVTFSYGRVVGACILGAADEVSVERLT